MVDPNAKHSDRGDRPLTGMQRRYIEERLLHPTGSYKSAALRAGYAPKTAMESASNMNCNPAIKAAIEEGRKKQMEKFEITSDRILQELCKVAFATLGETVTVNEVGDIVVQKDTPVEVSVETDGKGKSVRKIKTVRSADKVAALIQIGKHLGMFKDQVELSGKLSLVDLVEASFREIHPTV